MTIASDAHRATPNVVAGEFPAYREIPVVGSTTPASARVLVDRTALLDVLAARPDELVVITTEADELSLTDADDRLVATLAAVCSGTSMRIGFNTNVRGGALEASVGPDVLVELDTPTTAAAVRSADQGSFTTLVMPVRLEPAA